MMLLNLNLRLSLRYIASLLLLCLLAISQIQAETICNEVLAQRVSQEWPLRESDDPVSVYIQNLGQKLAQTTTGWHFKVIRDLAANSFSIGNGYVYITEGAILLAQTESEVAAILAHEIGHQQLGHFCALSHSINWLGWLFPKKEQTVGSLVQVIDVTKEKQADKYAVTVLKKTGYDCTAMLTVLERFSNVDFRRIKALEDLLSTNKNLKSVLNSSEFQAVKRKLTTE